MIVTHALHDYPNILKVYLPINITISTLESLQNICSYNYTLYYIYNHIINIYSMYAYVSSL